VSERSDISGTRGEFVDSDVEKINIFTRFFNADSARIEKNRCAHIGKTKSIAIGYVWLWNESGGSNCVSSV